MMGHDHTPVTMACVSINGLMLDRERTSLIDGRFHSTAWITIRDSDFSVHRSHALPIPARIAMLAPDRRERTTDDPPPFRCRDL